MIEQICGCCGTKTYIQPCCANPDIFVKLGEEIKEESDVYKAPDVYPKAFVRKEPGWVGEVQKLRALKEEVQKLRVQIFGGKPKFDTQAGELNIASLSLNVARADSRMLRASRSKIVEVAAERYSRVLKENKELREQVVALNSHTDRVIICSECALQIKTQ